jgi:hypothetical protein
MTEVVEKKKRGRKKKDANVENITITIETATEPPVAKKRGRKPKGGKIITKEPEKREVSYSQTNVILHLKCSLADIQENPLDKLSYNPSIPPEIETYKANEEMFSNYENESETKVHYAYKDNVCAVCKGKTSQNEDVNMKDINSKLKSLKINLYKDNLQDKKAACFWCTYEFDNHPCYIPKYDMDDKVFGYGSFCRPECAVAYLMKENIDDSTKFERYNLLNHLYGKIYNYEKNIKPAPNPYYTLDKFYGNLSIQEYRRLLNSEHLLLILEKPMTRILPELFEDNDNFVMNIYNNSVDSNSGNSNSVYKVKRQSEKKQTSSKKNIMQNTFGLA